MKFLLSFFLTTLALTGFSQQSDNLVVASNSFESVYRTSNPTFQYFYDSASQTHNYSNNWDLDKDGKKDEVYFVGTGGAHLYFFLRVVLSLDHKPREFTFIQSDFPLLTATDTLNFNNTQVGFVVTEFDISSIPVVIVRLDDQTFYGNKELKKRHIKTKNILISFVSGKTKYGCL